MGYFDLPYQIVVLAEINKNNELNNITLQLLGLGKELSAHFNGNLYAVAIGSNMADAGRDLSTHGADEVFIIDDKSLSEYNLDHYLPVLEKLSNDIKPDLILAGHISLGQDLMPRLAFALNAGLVTDCIDIKAKDKELYFIKPIYGGNALATQKVKTKLAMATVRSGVGKPSTPCTNPGKITPLSPVPEVKANINITARTYVDQKDFPLEEAAIIVSGGRGIGGKEGFQVLQDLADLLGGTVGATRFPCDLGWVSPSCQIGITGKAVAPDLYIAVGISGSTQHLSGMSDSKKIIAINRDPKANIFNISDYGAVGDWEQILPALIIRLKDLMGDRR